MKGFVVHSNSDSKTQTPSRCLQRCSAFGAFTVFSDCLTELDLSIPGERAPNRRPMTNLICQAGPRSSHPRAVVRAGSQALCCNRCRRKGRLISLFAGTGFLERPETVAL